MNAVINPIATVPAMLHNWVSAKIENAIVGTPPAQLLGNMSGRIGVIGIQAWGLGVQVPALTYLGVALMAMMLLVLLAALRRRGPVSPLEHKAAQERPSVISALGVRIPIHSVSQWFSTAMGRRFSCHLSGFLVKLMLVMGLSLQQGAGIGVRPVVILAISPMLAYFLAKK